MKFNSNQELFLFDEKTRLQGAINQHQVIIQPLDVKNVGQVFDNDKPYVAGFLKGNFTYSVGAQWEPTLDGLIGGSGAGLLTKAGSFAGSPLFASGLFKRKFYQGGGHIDFDIEFRMVSDKTYRIDETVGGEIKNPKAAAHFLAALCLPSPDPVGETVGKTIKAVGEGIDKGKQILKDMVKEGDTTGAIEAARKAGVAAGETLESALTAGGNALTSPYPRTIRVKIGNYFDSFDMILENVTATYSRESIYGDPDIARRFGHQNQGSAKDQNSAEPNLLAYQPLYVDFSLKVSTRTIPVSREGSANTGLITPQPTVSVSSEVSEFFGGNNGEQ